MSTSTIDHLQETADLHLGPNQSIMHAMDSTGDTKLIWDRTQPAEVANARATFDRLIKEGLTAYSVKGEKGEKGEVITKFDPDAERIIFARRMVGG